jgi:two-component system, LytTR family, response regulator
MTNICIIDNETSDRDFLSDTLTALSPDCRIIGEANSKATAIDLLRRVQPDALFLDIHLKDGTGFEVLAALPPPQYPLVFTTTCHEFALKAFQHNALDYLLKPTERTEVKRALEKIQKHQQAADLQKQMTEYLIDMQHRKTEKLVLHTAKGVHFLPISDVFHLESSGSYTTVWTNKGEKIIVSTNLGHFEHLTTDCDTLGHTYDVFFRIHQSHIVRMSTVRQLLKLPDGDFAVLDNGIKIPVARRRRDAFLAAMNG